MKKAGELVYLIESDPDVRDEILQILVSSEFETKCFECAADYIANTSADSLRLPDHRNGDEGYQRIRPPAPARPPEGLLRLSSSANAQAFSQALLR